MSKQIRKNTGGEIGCANGISCVGVEELLGTSRAMFANADIVHDNTAFCIDSLPLSHFDRRAAWRIRFYIGNTARLCSYKLAIFFAKFNQNCLQISGVARIFSGGGDIFWGRPRGGSGGGAPPPGCRRIFENLQKIPQENSKNALF